MKIQLVELGQYKEVQEGRIRAGKEINEVLLKGRDGGRRGKGQSAAPLCPRRSVGACPALNYLLMEGVE